MAQSLSKLYIHIIFHVKNPNSKIKNEDKNELYTNISYIIKDNKSIPIIINGVEDHIHILCVLSKNITLAKLIEEIKRHSSKWLKSKGINYTEFAWQGGYAGFSVSSSLLEQTKLNIEAQVEYHKKINFQDEYLILLKENGIDYDEKCLWID